MDGEIVRRPPFTQRGLVRPQLVEQITQSESFYPAVVGHNSIVVVGSQWQNVNRCHAYARCSHLTVLESVLPMPKVPDKGSVTRRGLAVLRVAIWEEPRIFALSVLAAMLYGAMTVAGGLALGWATDHVLRPAFESGRDHLRRDRLADRVVHRDRDPERDRRGRASARRRCDAVPAAGDVPPPGHPAVPEASARVAPPALDRHAALERQRGRRVDLVRDRSAADGDRGAGDAGVRDHRDVRGRRLARAGRLPGVPAGVRGERDLPALPAAARHPGAAVARGCLRGRARVVRRRARGEDAGP